MSFTVVPLHNLTLPAGTCIPFGRGFVLQEVPVWVKKDKGTLNDINRTDRQATLDATHALVAEYDAQSLGQPDPDWEGKKPKSIQALKFDSAILANTALWLRQPTPACFTVAFHALHGDTPLNPPIILQARRHNPLHCHPRDSGNEISVAQAVEAGKLHVALSTIPRKNSVWEALRSIWAALTSAPPDHRYAFFWLALEALFGPKDSGETTFKLSQRIAFFLTDTPEMARELYHKAKACYNTRSRIIHGRWEDDPKIDELMADTEAIVRTAMRRLLDNPEMLETFISKQRDRFLEDWVFSRATDPPPFPK